MGKQRNFAHRKSETGTVSLRCSAPQIKEIKKQKDNKIQRLG